MTVMPTAELVLSKLPLIITLWTAITLCWGVYMHGAFNKMMSYADQHKGGRRMTDKYNTWFIMAANVLLTVFLFIENMLAQYADVIIVINVFYDAFLVVSTITACRWWQSIKRSPPATPSP